VQPRTRRRRRVEQLTITIHAQDVETDGTADLLVLSVELADQVRAAMGRNRVHLTTVGGTDVAGEFALVVSVLLIRPHRRRSR